ncbi:hypothetical protein EVAR_69989_1 [Eumeta japonica]|uniref:Uncharacterized protein n=1 Tax=Eumeta variegata TaxID=151549 RepID=A0A4C1ZD98_EUMVA|nr:hypothetical protein EVAR_69989_1 [Eumeta japonica]
MKNRWTNKHVRHEKASGLYGTWIPATPKESRCIADLLGGNRIFSREGSEVMKEGKGVMDGRVGQMFNSVSQRRRKAWAVWATAHGLAVQRASRLTVKNKFVWKIR